MWLGGAVATGVNKGGEYINSKINKGEDVQVSNSTKTTLTTVKEKAGQVVDVTGNLLMQLYRPVAQKTKDVTGDISTKIDQSDNKSSKTFSLIVLQQGKSLTVATWGAASVALTGLGTAIS